ncbi:hypothetical protein TNIN_115251 [Trichonephila inaurata madagascariensis]|uniref:Uncharacterized protein n=1 Tax=Trichonephila inaurata madagascariensis TaxID=2747483 RepID=A0A8X6JZB2_9ARAC|nr:hypothetical protein TNIN_115251 [Trichonephila inaurata madagascariensis]
MWRWTFGGFLTGRIESKKPTFIMPSCRVMHIFRLNCALQGHMESAHHFSRKRIDIVSDQIKIRKGTSTTKHRSTKGDYINFYNPTNVAVQCCSITWKDRIPFSRF